MRSPKPGLPATVSPSLRVSAADVARAVGVSTATVSYVMNGRPGVSAELRARILDMAEQLGHASSARATHLRSQRTRVIGLVLNDIANPFYTEIAAGIIDAARVRGYGVFLAHTQESAEVLKSVIDSMIARQVDGIVLTVLHPDDGEVIRALRRTHAPFVQVSRRIERIDADFVGIDDFSAAAEMMEHVLGHGHREVAIIVGPRNSSASAARERGFGATAQAHGVRNVGAWRVNTVLTEAGGRQAVERMVSANLLPRAMVCGSDAIALGAMSALRNHGLKVPEDVAVTGFEPGRAHHCLPAVAGYGRASAGDVDAPHRRRRRQLPVRHPPPSATGRHDVRVSLAGRVGAATFGPRSAGQAGRGEGCSRLRMNAPAAA
jgi:LacI family transcriptional regulator